MQAEHKSGAVPDSLKILAVGNSFSQDCMRYLWDLLRRGGIRSVTLGNLYEPGCSLARHLELATGGAPVRTYEKKYDRGMGNARRCLPPGRHCG